MGVIDIYRSCDITALQESKFKNLSRLEPVYQSHADRSTAVACRMLPGFGEYSVND